MTADLAALVALLQSDDSTERRAAAEQLAHLGSDAQPAAVALVEACQRNDDEMREWVVAALEELGPPQSTDVAKLVSLLQRPSPNTAYWAATLLGRLGAQAAHAVPDLIETLASHPELAVRQRAAWSLGQIGPPAGAALETLQTVTASSDARLASLARDAIRCIGMYLPSQSVVCKKAPTPPVTRI